MAVKLSSRANSMTSPPDDERDDLSPAERVFAIYLLFDKILMYAVLEDIYINVESANCWKQVNSLWLENLRRILQNFGLQQKMEYPIIVNSFPKLVKLVRIYGNCSPGSMPPFHLAVDNWCNQEFVDCLLHCGEGLTELDIHCEELNWRDTGGSFQFPSVPLRLPKLEVIRIYVKGARADHSRALRNLHMSPFLAARENGKSLFLCNWDMERAEHRGFWKRVKNLEKPPIYWTTQLFVQRILTASENVKKISLSWDYGIHFNKHNEVDLAHFAGIDIEHLMLPSSLEELDIYSNCPIRARHLDHLSNNRLPSLNSLTLGINWVGTDNGINRVFRILNSFRYQLRHLDINASRRLQGAVQIPVMTRLETLVCGVWTCKRRADNLPILHTHFPALKKFIHFEPSKSTFFEWVESGTRCGFVEEVHIDLADICKMKHLNLAFPNVTQLELEFSTFQKQQGAMKYIFQGMTQLQTLQVHLGDIWCVSSYFYNAHLLGISGREAESLEQLLTEKGTFKCQFNLDSRASILNLKNLRKLHLSKHNSNALIYLDVAVKFGICRMPALLEFSFDGGLALRSSWDTVRSWGSKHLNIQH